MNVITHDRAYCLYPYLTLVMRTSVIMSSYSGGLFRHFDAIKKYLNRGFNMICFNQSNDMIRRLLGNMTRHLGDKYCWTIDLPHPAATHRHRPSTWELNSWAVGCDVDLWKDTSQYALAMCYNNIASTHLGRAHIVAGNYDDILSPEKRILFADLVKTSKWDSKEYAFNSTEKKFADCRQIYKQTSRLRHTDNADDPRMNGVFLVDSVIYGILFRLRFQLFTFAKADSPSDKFALEPG